MAERYVKQISGSHIDRQAPEYLISALDSSPPESSPDTSPVNSGQNQQKWISLVQLDPLKKWSHAWCCFFPTFLYFTAILFFLYCCLFGSVKQQVYYFQKCRRKWGGSFYFLFVINCKPMNEKAVDNAKFYSLCESISSIAILVLATLGGDLGD